MAEGKMKLNPSIFGVERVNLGYIYVVENSGNYKIGKSRNKVIRVKAAQTWLPDMNLIGVKPFWNYSEIEHCMHLGFSQYWYYGEWFKIDDEDARRILIEGFTEFSDFDADRNSVDFIYWFNGDGMAELVSEAHAQRKSVRKFQRDESLTKKIKFNRPNLGPS